ncbi:MAG: hypothetical protein GX247_01105 [Mollicutes bacterium]|nr:hypothetical protein [Mollicutes bacterium]
MEYKKVNLGGQEIEIPVNIDEKEMEPSYLEETIDLKEELELADQILEDTMIKDKSDLV